VQHPPGSASPDPGPTQGANVAKVPIKFQQLLLAITVAKKPIVNLRGGVTFKISDLKYTMQVAVDEC
jgi:hypothetical protein